MMTDRTDIVKALPEMLSGEALISALTVLPPYDDSIRTESQAIRLMALSDLYRIYLPSQMTLEIYSKLYLSLLRSLQKKGTEQAVRQRNENHKAISQQAYSGIIGGADSFTIIGSSGIGKTSAINKAISLITGSQILELPNPFSKIIPCLNVQCPFDCSVKGLMLEILRKADDALGTSYYHHAIKSRAYTVDVLIGVVSSVALNNIGLLVVDEIQNVVNSKNGKSLVGMLTQLINNSGISICMVGTNESSVFFEQAMQLARRSVGLRYGKLPYGRYFQTFCRTLFRYQYIRQEAAITPAIVQWLYEHSAGVISVVVALLHDAQEIAILTGAEALDLDTLNAAYQKRLTLLHNYLEPSVTRKPACRPAPTKTAVTLPVQGKPTEGCTISELANAARTQNLDIVSLLRQYISVEEVRI